MANTYTQIYIHVVFVVKNRKSIIQVTWEEELYKYLTGVVQSKGQKMLAINGVPNHLHFVIGMKPDCNLSELFREVKKATNSFIKEKKFTPFKFEWQVGYGAFSCGHSQLSGVITYIENQKEHHKIRTFKEEYLSMLEEFGVEYHDAYLFDWLE